jgi:RNA polymerase sigma-70 factor, ECF subfamily
VNWPHPTGDQMSVREAELPDGKIVARVLSGDRECFAVLVRRHQDALHRHALGMVFDPESARDLVQESFIRAYRGLSRCRDPEKFGGWLFQILRNQCRDHLKNRRRLDVSLDETIPAVANEDGPDAGFERLELRSVIDRALAQLPEAQREAFLMKHVEDRSYEEMAELLDCSESALKMRVLRAREALQSLLSDPAEAPAEAPL